MKSWKSVVKKIIKNNYKLDQTFSFNDFSNKYIDLIIQETSSKGKTPKNTLSFIFTTKLVPSGFLESCSNGVYKYTGKKNDNVKINNESVKINNESVKINNESVKINNESVKNKQTVNGQTKEEKLIEIIKSCKKNPPKVSGQKTWNVSIMDQIKKNYDIGDKFDILSFCEKSLGIIMAEVKVNGKTPHQTLRRELQILRDNGYIKFLGHEKFKVLRFMTEEEKKSNCSKGQLMIREILTSFQKELNTFEIIEDRHFEGLVSDRGGYLRPDFYIKFHDVKNFPLNNSKSPAGIYYTKLFIEYDGKQHFEPVDLFGGEETFKKLQRNDMIKEKFCEENGIFLLRFNYQNDYDECKKLIKYFLIDN